MSLRNSLQNPRTKLRMSDKQRCSDEQVLTIIGISSSFARKAGVLIASTRKLRLCLLPQTTGASFQRTTSVYFQS